jgi:hypothetical protein
MADGLIYSGCLAIVVGVSWLDLRAGLIVAGLFLVGGGVLVAVRKT